MSHKIHSHHQVQFPQVKGPTNLDFPKLTFKSKFGILLFSPLFQFITNWFHIFLLDLLSPLLSSFASTPIVWVDNSKISSETNPKDFLQIQLCICTNCVRQIQGEISGLSVDLRFPDFCGISGFLWDVDFSEVFGGDMWTTCLPWLPQMRS